ncbi:glycosyltransferase [Brachybacterium sp. Z12]|uniref:glycosyltransferase family 2 protein n=1 Tax=Brachybacterium sp. Z12 TaxID=2759167 RepID=UPI00223C3F59|nr:glycosyltransferase [Brachybacterium sp. Z12]
MSPAGLLTAHRPERVAVVIPAKNEAERIEATIESARRIAGVDLVVVVDDGSTDATSAVAMGADALVVRHKTNRGKAAAMATGAQVIAIREDAERADGGESFSEELHAEPREPGHTGPLPVIDPGESVPRALLFLDADMGGSAESAQPLVDAVLDEGVDMAIALLPPQDGASGMGIVVRTARRGIQRATGWEPTQPLSGTRCITRETWEACLPLAPGWGVETSLTIDALSNGFWVKEIPAQLHHRATGKDLRGQLHRAAQLRDVVRALARKRHLSPDLDPDAPAQVEAAPPAEEAPAETPSAETSPAEAPHTPAPTDHDEEKVWTIVPERESAQERAEHAEDRRVTLADLPVDGDFSDDETRALGDVDAAELDSLLRNLPVEGDFAPDDIVFLARTDLEALAARMGRPLSRVASRRCTR